MRAERGLRDRGSHGKGIRLCSVIEREIRCVREFVEHNDYAGRDIKSCVLIDGVSQTETGSFYAKTEFVGPIWTSIDGRLTPFIRTLRGSCRLAIEESISSHIDVSTDL